MYLTKRDKNILKFIEEYKSLTIKQCSQLFFNNCKESYYQARKRLKLLADNHYLKRYRKDMRSETVYYMDKKLSCHDLKVIDVYACLKTIGVDIKTFEREYVINCGGKEYRADGFFEFICCDGYFHLLLVEIDDTHFTSLNKLLDIYNSNYFQDKYKNLDDNLFPNVIIIRPFIPTNISLSLPFNVYYHTNISVYNIKQILN